ncbi:MAG: hypothetical protein JWP27_1963 [Flaviaesturariibacter sp.]|nr:hypothetical protein [Flaviaesturariibacter sp.]
MLCLALRAQRVPDRLIDDAVESVTARTPDSLAVRLTSRYSTDREKVRAIFRWVSGHITYDMDHFDRAARLARYKASRPDTTYEGRSLNERIAYGVLKRRKAVCDGYARLFQSLCETAGIRCIMITGYARSEGDHVNTPFVANHSWNAVYIDSSWQLLDATWASGYVVSNTDSFVASFDESYFLTPPSVFIRNHYPEDLEWTLLTNPPALPEFDQAPYRPAAFLKYRIASYSPGTGVIEAAVGDTVAIRLELSDADRSRKVAAGLRPDFLPTVPYESWVNIEPGLIVNPKRLVYRYIVPAKPASWLNIIYNKDVVLRYRLSIRTRPGVGG